MCTHKNALVVVSSAAAVGNWKGEKSLKKMNLSIFVAAIVITVEQKKMDKNHHIFIFFWRGPSVLVPLPSITISQCRNSRSIGNDSCHRHRRDRHFWAFSDVYLSSRRTLRAYASRHGSFNEARSMSRGKLFLQTLTKCFLPVNGSGS